MKKSAFKQLAPEVAPEPVARESAKIVVQAVVQVMEPEEPSEESLREMPEADFSSGQRKRAAPDVAARLRAAALGGVNIIGPTGKRTHKTYEDVLATVQREVQMRAGHPKAGESHGVTITRSVRFTPEVWAKLQKKADAQGITLHAAVRTALLSWLETAEG